MRFFKVSGDIQSTLSQRIFAEAVFFFFSGNGAESSAHSPTPPPPKLGQNTTHYIGTWEYFVLPVVHNISQYTQYGKIHWYVLVST